MATAVQVDKPSVNELYPSLLDACGRGDVITTQYLLNQGLKVDYIDERGNFPLLMASSFGRLELVKFLLDEAGATIDLINPRGESALSKAIKKGQTEVASLLQARGAKRERLTGIDISTDSGLQSSGSLKEEPVGRKLATATAHRLKGPAMLAPALKLLLPLASQWENIGVLLAIPIYQLECIKHELYHSSSACLREMLVMWVKQANPPATWTDLIEAIEVIEPYTAHKARDWFN